MSYILDALRKADAQRERDPARGIHAQPLQGPVDSPGGAPMRRPALWAAAVAGVAVIAGAAWYLARPGAPEVRSAPQVEAKAPRAAMPPPPAAQVLPPPVVVARAPVINAPAIIPVQAPAPAPTQATVQAPPLPAREASRAEPAPLVTAPTAAGQPPGMTPFQGPRGAGMSPVPANTAPMPPPRAVAPIPPSQPLPPVQGLPPDAPKLVINGGVYSANPAQRMLIVNGQVVKEGADLGSGVKLEQITAKSAVLGFRGARYTVGY
ncbi:MAG: general secretion pathway protein GspB [Pseudomonadota bacterium]